MDGIRMDKQIRVKSEKMHLLHHRVFFWTKKVARHWKKKQKKKFVAKHQRPGAAKEAKYSTTTGKEHRKEDQ
jgi:hypothetical protein